MGSWCSIPHADPQHGAGWFWTGISDRRRSAERLEGGGLVRVLAGWFAGSGYHLYYASRRQPARRLPCWWMRCAIATGHEPCKSPELRKCAWRRWRERRDALMVCDTLLARDSPFDLAWTAMTL